MGWYACLYIHGDASFAYQPFFDTLAVPGSGPEIRGNGEMFPLNGPSWSLFFEYIGNIMYALFIRRMSTKALTALIVLAGIGLASFAIFNFSGCGAPRCGVDDGRVQFDRWLLPSVIFFLDGIVDVARF